MFADGPLAAADQHQYLGDKFKAFLVAAREAAKGGLTWVEFGELLLAVIRISIATLDSVVTMTGAQKKALVMEAAAALFDTLADKAVPAAAWPVWVLARPSVRSLVLALASGAVEVVLPLVRSAQ